MIINNNIAALNTFRQLSMNQSFAANSLEKLSSGLRINRAGDDAAGLAISEKMRGQIRGLDQATRNAQDGISLIQTAEGALNETHAILQRMRELAVQSATDTNTNADRSEIQNEINQLTDEIDRIGATTEFNTQRLLTGDLRGVSAAVDGTMNFEQSNQAINFNQINNTIIQNITTTDTIRIRVSEASVSTVATTITTFKFSASNALGAINAQVGSVAAGTFIEANLADDIRIRIGTGTAAMTMTIGNVTYGGWKVGDTLTINIVAKEATVTTDSALRFHVGANTAQEIVVGLKDMRATAIGLRQGAGADALRVDSQEQAQASIMRLDTAITKVSSERSKMGAFQNRLEHTINNLGTSSENLSAAESRIRDVDMAREMMEFTKNNILTQAATAMLAQANQIPQGVLQLLR